MPPARNSQPITFTVLVRISFRTCSASGIMPTPRGFTGPITKSGDTPQGPSRSSRWPRLRVSKPTSPYRRPARITRSKKRDWFAASARSVTAAGTMPPRIGVAWGPARSKNTPRTVLRAGYGMFYDRFGQNSVLQAIRNNGVLQQVYTVPFPDFYPTVPAPASLGGNVVAPTIYKISPDLKAPMIQQVAFG